MKRKPAAISTDKKSKMVLVSDGAAETHDVQAAAVSGSSPRRYASVAIEQSGGDSEAAQPSQLHQLKNSYYKFYQTQQ